MILIKLLLEDIYMLVLKSYLNREKVDIQKKWPSATVRKVIPPCIVKFKLVFRSALNEDVWRKIKLQYYGNRHQFVFFIIKTLAYFYIERKQKRHWFIKF